MFRRPVREVRMHMVQVRTWGVAHVHVGVRRDEHGQQHVDAMPGYEERCGNRSGRGNTQDPLQLQHSRQEDGREGKNRKKQDRG